MFPFSSASKATIWTLAGITCCQNAIDTDTEKEQGYRMIMETGVKERC